MNEIREDPPQKLSPKESEALFEGFQKNVILQNKDNAPQSLKECCKALNKNVSSGQKKKIKSMKSYKEMIEFHFTLGMFIRNNWLESDSLLKEIGYAKGLSFMKDTVSGEILEYYWFYVHGYVNDAAGTLEELKKRFEKENPEMEDDFFSGGQK